MRRTTSLALIAIAAALGGCAFAREIGFAPREVDPSAVTRGATNDEPAQVVVRHVLLSFDGAGIPGVTRTKQQAQRLAEKVQEEARSGRDFAELVRLYSDDRAQDGTITIANWGLPAGAGVAERRKLVRGFTALAFTLPVGQVGLVEHDPNSSPYGWHVMVRVK